jgi:hypothetical protein
MSGQFGVTFDATCIVPVFWFPAPSTTRSVRSLLALEGTVNVHLSGFVSQAGVGVPQLDTLSQASTVGSSSMIPDATPDVSTEHVAPLWLHVGHRRTGTDTVSPGFAVQDPMALIWAGDSVGHFVPQPLATSAVNAAPTVY